MFLTARDSIQVRSVAPQGEKRQKVQFASNRAKVA